MLGGEPLSIDLFQPAPFFLGSGNPSEICKLPEIYKERKKGKDIVICAKIVKPLHGSLVCLLGRPC